MQKRPAENSEKEKAGMNCGLRFAAENNGQAGNNSEGCRAAQVAVCELSWG